MLILKIRITLIYYPPKNLESSVPKFLGTQIFSDAIGCNSIYDYEIEAEGFYKWNPQFNRQFTEYEGCVAAWILSE